jgi:hypothetical protein
MKSLPSARYHLILLGIAVLFAIGSATFLINQSHTFESSFQHPSLGGKAGAYSPSSSTDAATVLDHLKKGTRWEARENGASPYVSRPYLLKEGRLIDPMEGSDQLYPPVPNQWLIDHRLDYTDMNILERDPSHKGFTIREEFEAGTDPNDPKQFPPLCGKLSFDAGSIRKSTYLLEFLREEENNGTKELQIRPIQPLPNPAKGNRPDTSVRVVNKGDTIPGAPFLKVVDFQEKKKVINDTEYDVSELILQNTFTGERHTLIRQNYSREYKKGGAPIELIESVTFCYQLIGGAPEIITVDRGREFTLSSLDKLYSEPYKLVDISKDGVILDRQGKSFTIRPSGQSVPIAHPVPPSSTP